MTQVYLESPYAGDIERNVKYAHRCMLDCISRGESPYASHLLLTQVLDDSIPAERALGIECGNAMRDGCQTTVAYLDYGVSRGMAYGIEDSVHKGISVEKRFIGKNK